MKPEERTDIESKLCYQFTDQNLLNEALHHSSFVNEQSIPGLRDNERLEFLGDAVLNLAIGHTLMERCPEIEEGELSRIRATLVNESKLAKISRQLDLGVHIRLGKGERQTHGNQKPSILADALEAVIAAVYLDGGLDAANKLINTLFSSHLKAAAEKTVDQDFKSRLQELAQVGRSEIPFYQTVGEDGPDHDKTFHVKLRVSNITTSGVGKSKKTAEQDAARKALQYLKKDPEQSI